MKENFAPPALGPIGLATHCATGCGRGVRNLQHTTRLWLVSGYPIPNGAPDPIGYNVVAAMIIGKKRVPVYPKPNLKKGTVERTVFDSEYAKKEHERRNVDRRLYEKLSRYYPLPEGKREWARPPLLVKGKCGRDRSSCQKHSAYLKS